MNNLDSSVSPEELVVEVDGDFRYVVVPGEDERPHQVVAPVAPGLKR